MTDMDEVTMAKLAREMAMNIRNAADVFRDFGIDEETYYLITKNEFFKKVKEQFTIEWNSANSTEERLRLGSLAYLEQLTPILTRRAMKSDESLQAANDVQKSLMKMAGVGEDRELKTADRFVININLGGDVETFDKPIAIEPPTKEISDGRKMDTESPQPNGEKGNGGSPSPAIGGSGRTEDPH
jgi:hypothetical protein